MNAPTSSSLRRWTKVASLESDNGCTITRRMKVFRNPRSCCELDSSCRRCSPAKSWAALTPITWPGFRPSRWLVLPLVAAPLIYLLIQIGICGGIGNFVDTYRIYASLQQKLDYTVHYEKGPWFRYLLDFLAIAPVVFIAAIIGFFARYEESIRHGRNLALIYFASGVLFFGQMPIVNVRLVLFIDMFLRLGAAVAIAHFATQS